MAVAWTEEQKKVISLRDRDILVSAAAGSGKTAVLVQRILSKLMDAACPVDIDRMLIMTFTRAAAGEMKERIGKALEQALYEEPENEHLQRQMTLLHTAQITTIDGFCAYVIRNYFHLIGLDPGYRTADEGELKLLKEDVFKTLLEDAYAKDEEAFLGFVERYAPGKTDEGLKELVLELYDAAMSNPYPQEWLDACLSNYEVESVEELRKTPWFSMLWEETKEDIREAKALASKAKKICLEAGGPYLYEEALDSDLLLAEDLGQKVEEEDYEAVRTLLAAPGFARLSAKKAEDVDEWKKNQVKALREEEKAILKELKEKCFSNSLDGLLEETRCCREPLGELVRLTRDFMERFAEKKREKNLLDFTDMEHFALKILMTKEDGVCHMSQAARELSDKYDEVLVDEYQDSNNVQELLTNCVSGWASERKNTFMVGDVKQSIYRFRLARPELFMEKYRRYTLTDSKEQRIDLRRNFRSRAEVLESVNFIFRQIMGMDLGGIAYDDAAALYPGAVFPEGGDPSFPVTEVLLMEKESQELELSSAAGSAQEIEALGIAQRIQAMVGREKIVDKETGEYRPVEYGDIVVLLRTSQGWADVFSEVFSSQGIPSYTASRTGYFSATEVVTVLNYLRVCDNPLQDIPLAGVLRSPMVGCTSEELAMVRKDFREGRLFDSVRAYAGDGQLSLFAGEDKEESLREKLRHFLDELELVRSMTSYTPVHRLILHVLEATQYGKYARALPDGAQRGANLAMLVEKAMDYEKTSYRGLFNFVRYIEQLQKYEVDFGEVSVAGAGAGAVQIMTIHKSKGLEFPVVFAAGMGKQFNFRDMNAGLLVHPELGLGADAILPEKRIIASTLGKQMIRRQLKKESLGEELRVLYVALTRAKEKLILTGTVGDLEKTLASLERVREEKEMLLPLGMRMSGKKFWDYILPALARHRCMEGLFEQYGFGKGRKSELYDAAAKFLVEVVTPKQMAQQAVIRGAQAQMNQERLKNWDCEAVYDEEIRRRIKERFDYQYPYGYLAEIPAKVSVSELKKRSYQGEYDREEAMFFEPDIIPLVPRFVEEKEEEYVGAARGTAYHGLMEWLDYTCADTADDIEEQLEALRAANKLKDAEAACIRTKDVLVFLESSVGQRMKKAALSGGLFREQPFVISVPASELNEEWTGEETVLVQGIIDAYFSEGEELVLVDYKTDRVRPGEENRLVELYHVQLEDYAKALERMTGKKVREKYIYSFALGKEIAV